MHEILIIGGGVIGLLSARELASTGARVTLIEQTATGRESSWAGGGILSPLHPWRYPEAVSALAAWSQRHYPALCRELTDDTGIDPQWNRNGLLVLGADERGQALAWSGRWEQPVEPIDHAAIARLEPALAQRPESGLWLPRIAQVRNPRLVKALRADLLRRGVELLEQTPVERLLTRSGRITGVATPGGRLDSERVLLCAGAWSGRLLQPLGTSLPVEPVQGQMILFSTPPGALKRITLAEERYAIPRRDGRVLFGSTLERIGFDKTPTDEARDALRQTARRLFPVLESAPIEHHWAGLRPGSPDGIPFIGEHPEVAGLFVNTGHFRNGVVLAPASARLAAEQILERQPSLPTAPYRLMRG